MEIDGDSGSLETNVKSQDIVTVTKKDDEETINIDSSQINVSLNVSLSSPHPPSSPTKEVVETNTPIEVKAVVVEPQIRNLFANVRYHVLNSKNSEVKFLSLTCVTQRIRYLNGFFICRLNICLIRMEPVKIRI